jgi:hypothetical protein
LYLVGEMPLACNAREWGLDAAVDTGLLPVVTWQPWYRLLDRLKWERKRLLRRPTIFQYKDVCESFVMDRSGLGTQEPLEHRLIFIKSWNEWAEGNYMEPDLQFGHGYLEVLRDELRGET